MNTLYPTNTPIPIEDIPREIMKMVDRYQPSEVIDLVCLQRDLNILLSDCIRDHYNISPEIEEPEPVEMVVPETPTMTQSMNEIFMNAAKEMITDFKESIEVVDTTAILEEINTKYKDITPFDEEFGIVESVPCEVVDTPEPISRSAQIALDIAERHNISNFMVEPNDHNDPKAQVKEIQYLYFITIFGQKYIMTQHQYEKQGYTYVVSDRIPDEEWIEQNHDHIKKHPELFQKLVDDKLKYIDFLTLEGWIDTPQDFDPFGKPVEIQPAPPVPVSTKPDFKLTDHQQLKYDGLIEKINAIIQSQMNLVRPPNPAYYMTVLEGAAGTGKTTMMVKVLETLSETYKIVFCSPTHQALGVIRETLLENWLPFTEDNDEYLLGDSRLIIKTLASFLGIKMKRDEENGTESFEEDPKAAIITCDILAIDESSMVSKDQLKILLKKLHINVKCILFIGDEVQLDSPSDNNESNGIFQLPQKFALEEVVRQAADNKILQFAWELRDYILKKNCPYYPSQLLHPARANLNITIYKDQTQFMTDYFQNPEQSKLIATYTNKITNEYNDYVRQMRLTGNGVPLDIDIDGNGRNIIANWDEYKEWYVGEECVALEPNQRGGEVVHQTGEKFIIDRIQEETKTIYIEIMPDTHDLNAEPVNKEFIIPYWKIVDTKGKTIWVVKKEFQQEYNDILAYLSLEAKRKIGKFKWAKYWDIKEKFVRVNKTFAFTLHKLQGSTCKEIYIDARDLDKFFPRMMIGVYKLIYIALTRPKQRVVFLIN